MGQASDRLGQTLGIGGARGWGDQDAAGLVQIIGRAAPVGTDHRQAHPHRLEHDRPAAFPDRVEDQRVGGSQDRGAGGLRQEAMKADDLRQAQSSHLSLKARAFGSVAEDVEGGVSSSCAGPCQRVERDIHRLPADKASHEHQPERRVSLTRAVRGCGPGRRIDAVLDERDDVRVVLKGQGAPGAVVRHQECRRLPLAWNQAVEQAGKTTRSPDKAPRGRAFQFIIARRKGHAPVHWPDNHRHPEAVKRRGCQWRHRNRLVDNIDLACCDEVADDAGLKTFVDDVEERSGHDVAQPPGQEAARLPDSAVPETVLDIEDVIPERRQHPLEIRPVAGMCDQFGGMAALTQELEVLQRQKRLTPEARRGIRGHDEDLGGHRGGRLHKGSRSGKKPCTQEREGEICLCQWCHP